MQDIFPGRYDRIVRRCLQDDPLRRYSSVRELERGVRRYRLPVWLGAAAVLAIGLGVYSLLPTPLDRARAEVDAWYDAEVSAFRQALQDATTEAEAYEAWAALADKTSVINEDIPSRLPESSRPALRDYLFERYNATFPLLQQELTSRLSELP